MKTLVCVDAKGGGKKEKRFPVVIFYPGLSHVTANTRNCFMFDCGTRAQSLSLTVPICAALLRTKPGS